VSHTKTDGSGTAWIIAKGFFVEGKGASKILFVEGNACLAQKGGDVVLVLLKHEVELGICLVHFAILKQTEVRPTQQMLLQDDNYIVTGDC